MSDSTIRFDDGASYELMMGRWSVLVGERFIDWIGVPNGMRWLTRRGALATAEKAVAMLAQLSAGVHT